MAVLVIVEGLATVDAHRLLASVLVAPVYESDAWFTVDQPSKQFASFDNPDIAKVGIELDHKLAALLDTLAVPVPTYLRE